jgi:hypothetical protein
MARGAGGLAGAIAAQRELLPEDDVTRRRLIELMFVGGVEPSPAMLRTPPPPRPVEPRQRRPVAAPEGLPDEPRRTWLSARLGEFGLRGAVVVAALGVPVTIGIVVGVVAGWRPAAIVLGLTLLVAAALRAPAWRRRFARPVTSELSMPVFEARGADASPVLDVPTAGVDPPIEPLLVPRWTTGILTAALAIETRDGALDVDRLVDELARLRVPTGLPRHTRRSIGSGAQVLVDFSDDMFPLREDVFGILQRLRRVFAEDGLTVLRFAGRPLTEIGPGPRVTWARYEPPSVRRPVLAITNFGLMDARTPADADRSQLEWAELARELQQLRCPLVALVPNRAADVPPQIRSCVAVVEWDWTTTAASASRAVRG